jgi:hypothetical protein
MVAISCGGERRLSEVVDGADHSHSAFTINSLAQELEERSCLFDLSEHRLDHLLAQPNAAAVAGAAEPGAW